MKDEADYSSASLHRMTGEGVDTENKPQPEPVRLSQKEIKKLIAKRNGVRVRSGYTIKKPTRDEILARRKKDRQNRKKNRQK